MTDCRQPDPASEFVARWARAIAATAPHPRRALDLAMGRGRHARLLADAGFRVFGVDSRLDAVREGIASAAADGLIVRGWCADLTRTPLPRGWFALVVVTRYLQRDLFPAIADALAPGGMLLYETFTEAQRELGRGPTSPDHLLKPGELRRAFEGLEIVAYDEVSGPDALARLAARRRTSSA
jgi:SAM-dependent methyltransferase